MSPYGIPISFKLGFSPRASDTCYWNVIKYVIFDGNILEQIEKAVEFILNSLSSIAGIYFYKQSSEQGFTIANRNFRIVTYIPVIPH